MDRCFGDINGLFVVAYEPPPARHPSKGSFDDRRCGRTLKPALFDLPWIQFYLAIVFLLHFLLLILATAGAVIVLAATVVGEILTKKAISESVSWNVRDLNFSESSNIAWA